MGKNKLKKFKEMENLDRVFQYPFARLQSDGGFPLRGKWGKEVFGNDRPIVLELGCGKGEYTTGLAGLFPEKNFIGIDIKGARMWTGACRTRDLGLTNAAFLRTSIELLAEFFAPGEVSEIWITFPDPQMKKTRKRLTSTRFMELYRQILRPGGLIHLKSDSPFLFAYTSMMADHNRLPVIHRTDDLYHSGEADEILGIRTHYEQQWLDRGLTIKYIAFELNPDGTLYEPPGAEELEFDTYRSYSRGYIQMPGLMAENKDHISDTTNND